MTTSQFSGTEGNLSGAVKDKRNITAEWVMFQDFIDGVTLKEVKNVLKPGGGELIEIYRKDWGLDDFGIVFLDGHPDPR